MQVDSINFLLGTQARGVLLYNSTSNSVSQLAGALDTTQSVEVGALAYDSSKKLLWIG